MQLNFVLISNYETGLVYVNGGRGGSMKMLN